MDRKRIVAYIEVTFAVIVWGASFIATKLALRDLAPVTVVWLRFGIGVVILGVITLIRRQLSIPNKKDLAYFAFLGILGITFHQWLQSTALETSQASTSAWILATTPIFIALLSWIFLKENLTWVQIIGILLATSGVLLVVSKGNIKSLYSSHFGEPGDILILVSALNWAAYSILSRHGLQKHHASQMMFYVMLTGWLFTTILFLSGGNFQDIKNMTGTSLMGIGFLSIICSGLGYIAYYDGLQVITASQVGAFFYLEPLVAVIVAWIFLGETVIPIIIAGGVVILLGVRMVQRYK